MRSDPKMTGLAARRRFMLAAAGVMTGGYALSAQASRRAVRGTVTDQNGIPLKGAAVLLKNTWSLRVRSFITQKDGQYRFRGLESNVDYELRATYLGASSDSKRLGRFDSDQEAVIDLTIKIAGGMGNKE